MDHGVAGIGAEPVNQSWDVLRREMARPRKEVQRHGKCASLVFKGLTACVEDVHAQPGIRTY